MFLVICRLQAHLFLSPTVKRDYTFLAFFTFAEKFLQGISSRSVILINIGANDCEGNPLWLP